MEIEFDERPKNGKPPKTRLYTPGKEPDATGRIKTSASRDRYQEEGFDDEEGFHIRVKSEEMTPLARIGLIFSGFLLAGMILFTLTGYERISRAYADINALNDEIELTNLRIVELDVKIECAVTIQDAQAWAEQHNMRYPEQAQYLKIGDYIPITGTLGGTTDTAGATGTPGTTELGTLPEDQQAQPTQAPQSQPVAEDTIPSTADDIPSTMD